MKEFCNRFFQFFTWGEDGEESRTLIKIVSSKTKLKTCHFEVVVFSCDAEIRHERNKKKTI